MNQLLEMQLPILNHKYILLTELQTNEVGSVIRNLPTMKTLMTSYRNHTFKEELTPVLFKLFQKLDFSRSILMQFLKPSLSQ